MDEVARKLQKATKNSKPSTLFDDLSPFDKLLNRLIVKVANALRRCNRTLLPKGHINREQKT